MKLRTRITLTTLAALVPLAAALGGLFVIVGAQVVETLVTQYAYAVAAASRASCEAAPDRWGGPVGFDAGIGTPPFARGLEVYAYDASGRPSRASAPALSPALLASLQAGAAHASRRGEGLEVLVGSGETGPCAYLLFRRPAAGFGSPVAVPLALALLCSLVVLVVVLASLGPIVRRIRRLRDEVRASSAAGYRHQITTSGNDELAELAGAFADSGREIGRHLDAQERRERTLREFVANTTHDVMLPLTVLQGHLAALRDGTAQGHDAAAVLRAAMQESDYIASLVRNLEVAARLDAGEPDVARDPIALSPLLLRVIARHAPLARRRAVELVHAVPERSPVVIGDLTLIEQAISNLVQNAVLHNHAGGHVAAILEMDDAQRFRITFKDDGPGIPQDELARVLDRGERGDAARTRHPHGSGLGLSIAARVAAAHAWTFDLHSGPEGGLEVELVGAIAPPA